MSQDASTERLMKQAAARIDDRATELTALMADSMATRIPELPADPDMFALLTASCRSNVQAAVDLLHSWPEVGVFTVPEDAGEYARRLAQRGAPTSALVRAYRLGHQLFLEHVHELVATASATDPAAALTALREVEQITFVYIDWVSEQVIGEYEAERSRWLQRRGAMRADVLRRILSGEDVDLAAAEAALDHRLRGRHLAAVLWTTEPGDQGHQAIEAAVASLGRATGAAGRPLVWNQDRDTVWVWLSSRGDEPLWGNAGAVDPGRRTRLALGRPATGVAGFRQSHREAVRAAKVASLGGTAAAKVVSFDDPDVRLAATLAADPEGLRAIVASALGPLAQDSPAAARLRETVRVFLTEQGSYVAAAARLHLHRNTVKYRVDKAAELRGRPFDEEDRLEVQVALAACRLLGASATA